MQRALGEHFCVLGSVLVVDVDLSDLPQQVTSHLRELLREPEEILGAKKKAFLRSAIPHELQRAREGLLHSERLIIVRFAAANRGDSRGQRDALEQSAFP